MQRSGPAPSLGRKSEELSMPRKSAISGGCESRPANRSLGQKWRSKGAETTCGEAIVSHVIPFTGFRSNDWFLEAMYRPIRIARSIIVVVRSANLRLNRGAINDYTTVISRAMLKARRSHRPKRRRVVR